MGIDLSEIFTKGFWSNTISLMFFISDRVTEEMLFLRRKREEIELGRLMLYIEFREL